MKSSHPLLGLLTGAIVALSYVGCSNSQVKPGNTPSGSITQPTANQTPVGTINLPVGNTSIITGQSVTFAASASDPNGNPVTVLWNFGDGSTSTALAPGAHTYAAAGTYTVTFTATESHGLVATTPPTRTISS